MKVIVCLLFMFASAACVVESAEPTEASSPSELASPALTPGETDPGPVTNGLFCQDKSEPSCRGKSAGARCMYQGLNVGVCVLTQITEELGQYCNCKPLGEVPSF